jgi:hypothetical protein
LPSGLQVLLTLIAATGRHRRSFNKGVALGALGRSEEAIAGYDDVLARLAMVPELPLREQVAKARD